METKTNDQTNAAIDFGHIKEMVLGEIDSTINWRNEKAHEFDWDARNKACVDNLEKLHQKISELPETHDFFRALCEFWDGAYFSDSIEQFGFHGEECANMFIEDIIELVQEEKEV